VSGNPECQQQPFYVHDKQTTKHTETIQRLSVGMMKEGYRYEHASVDVEGQDQYKSLSG